RIFAGGLTFANAVQNESEWWIFWGRVAGGLTRNQQTDIYQRLSATLQPKRGQRVRVNTSLLREMWRCARASVTLPRTTRPISPFTARSSPPAAIHWSTAWGQSWRPCSRSAFGCSSAR
ncbi:MAG: hypothetical protein HC871_16580, partial [Rhizobiales bacterium]|nr:hypothetical protein [Hyphomicrobiales bacterium]